MGNVTIQAGAILAIAVGVMGGCKQESPQKPEPRQALPAPQAAAVQRGAELFNQYCSPCHPNGGNVSDPRRTLAGSSLRANHITSPGDIVRIMRNPISRMIRFDTATISDQDALAIAEYVLTTFK